MHQQVLDWIGLEASALPPGVDVLEIGSLDINGTVRPLFAGAGSFHGIDLVPGPGVDEVADGAVWHPPRSYDVVLCAEVLEHAPRWPDVVGTMWRACRPGGTLLITCATDPRPPHSAIDGLDVRPDEHYANVGAADLLACLHVLGATDVALEVAGGRGDLYGRARR